LLPLYNAQWWGYESLTAIVLVVVVIIVVAAAAATAAAISSNRLGIFNYMTNS